MLKYIGIGAKELDTYLDYALLSIVAIYLYNALPTEMGLLGACFALPFLFSGQFTACSRNQHVAAVKSMAT